MLNKCCAILGSGFGLYGYLPAMIKKGYRILLPERYKQVVLTRADLSDFFPKVTFVADEWTAISNASSCLVAKRPVDQVLLVEEILERGTIKHLFLEKPLAPTPKEALNLLNLLFSSEISIRIGYSFLYTDWGKKLVDLIEERNAHNIFINWYFTAHHFKNDLKNWKRYDDQGGGAIRFFGIQIIALLSIAPWKIRDSTIYYLAQNESYRWKATIEYETGPLINVDIHSYSAESYFICGLQNGQNTSVIYHDTSPFLSVSGKQDSRVSVLCDLIDIHQPFVRMCDFYYKAVQLWDDIERNSRAITER